jgi:hypothetical protein
MGLRRNDAQPALIEAFKRFLYGKMAHEDGIEVSPVLEHHTGGFHVVIRLFKPFFGFFYHFGFSSIRPAGFMFSPFLISSLHEGFG